jgi:hypothetical protein
MPFKFDPDTWLVLSNDGDRNDVDEWMFWGALNRPQLLKACRSLGVKNTGASDVLRARLVRVGCVKWIRRCSLGDLTKISYKLKITVIRQLLDRREEDQKIIQNATMRFKRLKKMNLHEPIDPSLAVYCNTTNPKKKHDHQSQSCSHLTTSR